MRYVRFLDAGNSQHPDEYNMILRIIKVLLMRDVSVSPNDALRAWEAYSKALGVDWMGMTSVTDDDLYDRVMRYLG